jgi:hypothetical protein
MEKENNNPNANKIGTIIIPFFVFTVFIIVSINSISRGVENHETWRIVLASLGGAFFLAFNILLGIKLIKNIRKAA